MDQSESAYRIRGATASYLRGKGVVLEEDIRSREYGFYTAMNDVMGCLKKKKEGKEEGVYAIASSFGYLFELVLHLTSPEVNIPVTGLGVGPVTPADIRKVTQLPQRRKHTVLAFQVQVTPKASHLAQTLGVKIICGDTIEHLCQQFQECKQELGEDKKDSESDVAAAVSPCLLSILPKCVLNKEDPIVVGVYVVEGFVKVGTPLCIPHRAFVNIGRVAWIQKDQRPVQLAREGEKVIIKIVAADPKTLQGMMLGIDFDEADVLVSRTSRVAVYQVEINR